MCAHYHILCQTCAVDQARISIISVCYILMFLAFQNVLVWQVGLLWLFEQLWTALLFWNLYYRLCHDVFAVVYRFQLLPLYRDVGLSLCKVPLFVVILVLSACISMPNFVAALSNVRTRELCWFVFLSCDTINVMGKTGFVILRLPLLVVPL